jgi:hypothetical protein
VGKRAWFGPRLLGWGWTPVSWEGYTVTLVAVVLIVTTGTLYDGSAADLALWLIVAALLVVSILKGSAP